MNLAIALLSGFTVTILLILFIIWDNELTVKKMISTFINIVGWTNIIVIIVTVFSGVSIVVYQLLKYS